MAHQSNIMQKLNLYLSCQCSTFQLFQFIDSLFLLQNLCGNIIAEHLLTNVSYFPSNKCNNENVLLLRQTQRMKASHKQNKSWQAWWLASIKPVAQEAHVGRIVNFKAWLGHTMSSALPQQCIKSSSQKEKKRRIKEVRNVVCGRALAQCLYKCLLFKLHCCYFYYSTLLYEIQSNVNSGLRNNG